MKKLLFLSFLLLAGCDKFDKVQTLNNCLFDFESANLKLNRTAGKDEYQLLTLNKEEKDYVYSCMRKSGYELDFSSLFPGESTFPDGWKYTWRVFL